MITLNSALQTKTFYNSPTGYMNSRAVSNSAIQVADPNTVTLVNPQDVPPQDDFWSKFWAVTGISFAVLMGAMVTGSHLQGKTIKEAFKKTQIPASSKALREAIEKTNYFQGDEKSTQTIALKPVTNQTTGVTYLLVSRDGKPCQFDVDGNTHFHGINLKNGLYEQIAHFKDQSSKPSGIQSIEAPDLVVHGELLGLKPDGELTHLPLPSFDSLGTFWHWLTNKGEVTIASLPGGRKWKEVVTIQNP